MSDRAATVVSMDDFRALWDEVQRNHELRELWAARARIDERLLELGMTMEQLAGHSLTMNFKRDQRRRRLSAELEFIDVATAYGASHAACAPAAA